MERPADERAIDVFISHASEDRALAGALRRDLESRGITCWMAPADVRGSTSWAEQIVAAIERSRAVIVLISAAANGSTHVAREVNLAQARAKAVLPVRVADVRPTGALEYLVTLVQRVDAFPPPAARHFAAIAARLADLLERQVIAPPTGPSGAGRRRVAVPAVLVRPPVIAAAGAGLLALAALAFAFQQPAGPGPTASPVGTVTLLTVDVDGSVVSAEGTYQNLRLGRDGVLLIGQPKDGSRDWLPVWATLVPESQAGGFESGHWQAGGPRGEGGYRWYAVIGPMSSGAAGFLSDVRENGPDSDLVLARSEPRTTD